MKYKEYDSVIAYDEEVRLFHGEVINIRDMITFQGTNVEDLEKAYHESVDDYLDFCTSRGELPEKSSQENSLCVFRRNYTEK